MLTPAFYVFVQVINKNWKWDRDKDNTIWVVVLQRVFYCQITLGDLAVIIEKINFICKYTLADTKKT